MISSFEEICLEHGVMGMDCLSWVGFVGVLRAFGKLLSLGITVQIDTPGVH